MNSIKNWFVESILLKPLMDLTDEINKFYIWFLMIMNDVIDKEYESGKYQVPENFDSHIEPDAEVSYYTTKIDTPTV